MTTLCFRHIVVDFLKSTLFKKQIALISCFSQALL